MKYTYSGFQSPDEKKDRRRGITVMQIAPIFVVFIAFFLITQFKSFNGTGSPSETTGAAEISNSKIRFYYIVKSGLDYTLFYADKPAGTEPGKGILALLEAGFKEEPPNGSYLTTIPDDANINSISTDDEAAVVDFTGAFAARDIDYAYEAASLKAVAYTVGSFFNVSKVKITVDGKPYSGKNITLDEDYFIEITGGL